MTNIGEALRRFGTRPCAGPALCDNGSGKHRRSVRWALGYWLVLLSWVCCWSTARADRGTPATVDASAFGQSILLNGPWLAAAGDDPRWADPAFDDRQWRVLDPARSLSAQGFRNAPYLWYRLHLHLRTGGPRAAVYVVGLNKNYVLFANGERIGGAGGMKPSDVDREHPPTAFEIPEHLVNAAGGSLVLALRVNGGPVGFYDLAPLDHDTRLELVHPTEVQQWQSFNFAHHWIGGWAIAGLSGLIGLCGLVIWWSLRDQPEYLALAVWLLSGAMSTVVYFRAHVGGVTATSGTVLLMLFLRALTLVGEVEFMRLLLRERRTLVWTGLQAVCLLSSMMIPLLNTGALPFTSGAVAVLSQVALTELFILAMLVRGALRGNRDAPLLLLPVVLWSFTDLYHLSSLSIWAAMQFQIPDLPVLHVASYDIQFGSLADALGMLSLLLILVRRTVRLTQDKAELANEVAAAEELQGLLMSRASRPTPGYHVQTAYRPMQQVGGDFFLVQPCDNDGSLVAIVGDVSGKGLQAAMRVSLILGVLQREAMGQPDRVLRRLNTALLDQGDLGFTTACCVRLEADGSFRFANAGHLNPYIDGRELESQGALPLGMEPEGNYVVQCGQLLAGQRLVLLSDGVVEARSKQGELFGFERTRGLLRMEASAVADVVQRFGQADDITVMSVALA